MKQRKIFALFGALFLLVSSLFSGLFLFLNQGIPMRATDAGTVCPPKTIVLDAGHGGEDSGALGVDGVKEKDLNLQITLILSDLFRAGASCVGVGSNLVSKALIQSGSFDGITERAKAFTEAAK